MHAIENNRKKELICLFYNMKISNINICYNRDSRKAKGRGMGLGLIAICIA